MLTGIMILPLDIMAAATAARKGSTARHMERKITFSPFPPFNANKALNDDSQSCSIWRNCTQCFVYADGRRSQWE